MSHGELVDERLTHSVIGAFFDVYNTLGFGFLEQLYVRALEIELLDRGHSVSREYAVRIHYRGIEIGTQRLDMVVDQRLIVEVKSAFEVPKIADRQVYNYLKATNLELGLLLHFGPKPSFRKITRRRKRDDSK